MSAAANIDLAEDRLFSLGWGLIYKSVCAPKSWSADKVSVEATKADPPGTSANKWVVTNAPTDELPANPVPCPDNPNRVHWCLNC